MRNPPTVSDKRAGTALILTLAMLVLLSAVVLAYMLTVRTEYVAAKSYESGTDARLLADSTVNLVIAQIRDASTQPDLAWISQPGLIRTFAIGATPVNSYKLYSADSLIESGSFDPTEATDLPATAAWKTQPSLWTDLNAPVADLNLKDPFDPTKPLLNYPIFDGNHLQAISDPTTGKTPLQMSLLKDNNVDVEGFKVEDRYADGGVTMPVKWLYMLKDGTLVPAKASGTQGDVEIVVPADKQTTAQGEFNDIVGRVAFWTDDETAKVNINTASEGTFWDTPMVNTLPGNNPDTSYLGTEPDATFEFELAYRQGATHEYQRYSGHPATTCLSTIFGRQLLQRSSIAGDRAKMAEEIFKLIPRVTGARYDTAADPQLTAPVEDNSSKAGTVRGGGGGGGGNISATTFKPVTEDSDRLYATIDEFIYNPNFAPGDDQDKPRTTWTLAEPKPGRDTTREMLEISKFLLTANSKAPEQNLYNLPRISIWPAMMLPADQNAGKIDRRTPFDKVLAFCSTVGSKDPGDAKSPTNPHLPFYFTRQSSGSSGMLVDASGNPTGIDPKGDLAPGISPARPSRNLYLMAYLRELSKRPAPGWDTSASANKTFKAKYGQDSDQILTEIFDYIRTTNLADRTDAPLALSPVALGSPAAAKAVNASPYSYTQTTPDHTVSYNGVLMAGPGDSLGIPTIPVYGPDTLRTSTLGEVVPIQMADVNGSADGTRGIGRIATITGLALIVTRLPDNPLPTPAPDPRTMPAYGSMTPAQKYWFPPTFTPAMASDPTFLASYGTFSQNAQLQFVLLPQLNSPMPGYCVEGQGFRITFSNIVMNVTVIDAAGNPIPGFTNKNVFQGVTPPTIYSKGQVQLSRVGGVIGTHTMMTDGTMFDASSAPPSAIWQVPLNISPGTGKGAFWETAAPPNPPGATLLEKNAPVFITNTLEITCTATATITGPTAVTAGVTNPTNTTNEPIIQTFKFKFPKFKAPMPILTSWVNGRPLSHVKNSEGGSVPRPDSDAIGYLVNPANPKLAGARLQYKGNCRIFANKNLRDYTNARDVVRTLALTGNASGTIVPGSNPGLQGDMRITSAMRSVPAEYFQPADPDFYDNDKVYIAQSCIPRPDDSMVWGTGSNGQWFGETNSVYGVLVANNFGGNAGDFKTYAPPNYYNTNPFSGYGQSVIPATETIAGKASPINGVKNVLGQPGDWDTGPFWVPDGPYCNKADEGSTPFRVNFNVSPIPYIGSNVLLRNTIPQAQSYFSPNRMIPSPVMFGSLPTGVKRGHPWQTLLFRPAKAYLPGGTNHPGNANAGPADHLLLDLFWMPVVEPYAISEPFATAGKINLNQQIAPFINIRRDTGLRAVMKSVKIASVNPNQTSSNNLKFATYYKNLMANNRADGVVIRRSIDLDNTLKQITDRQDKNKPFISASEICDISLIPKDIPLVTDPGMNNGAMKAHVSTGFAPNTALTDFDSKLSPFWASNTYTGDNLLEKPYGLIYPRLTTRSNTYTVHVRVQTLAPNAQRIAAKSYILKTNQSKPVGEFRGSFVIERYLDPNKAGFVNASGARVVAPANGDTTGLALGPYRFRVISSKQFTP